MPTYSNFQVGRRSRKQVVVRSEDVSPVLISPYPSIVVANDSFTDADSTNLTSHTMNTGAGWTAGVGSITVVSNKAVCQNATNAYFTSVTYRDVKVTCKFTCGAANSGFAPTIIVHAQDSTHWMGVYFSGDGNGIIYRLDNTTFTVQGTFQWVADTNEHTAIITYVGDELTIKLDGGSVWKYILASQNSSILCGIRGFVSGASKDKFDDFKVEAYINTPRLDSFPNPLAFNTVTDNFTQVSGTHLSSFGWTEDNGNWTVTNNKAGQSLTTSITNGYVVSRDVGASDYAIELAITTPASGNFISGIVFRMVDLNNYIECEINTTNGVTGIGKGFALWYTNNLGAYVELSSTHFIPANSSTYTMRVRAVGQLITAELVEASLSIQCNSRWFLNATRVGIFEARSPTTYATACSYDNYKVYLG